MEWLQTLQLASVGSDYEGPWFWLLGPAGGIGFYTMTYLRYRNTDKRYAYEYKTDTSMSNVQAADQRVGSVQGVRNSSIPGKNSSTPRTRLGAASFVTDEWAQKNSAEPTA